MQLIFDKIWDGGNVLFSHGGSTLLDFKKLYATPLLSFEQSEYFMQTLGCF